MKPANVMILVVIPVLLTGCFFFSNCSGKEKSEYDLYHEKGIQAYEKKDYTAFLEHFRRLDRLEPNDSDVMYHLAKAHALNKNKTEALRYLTRAGGIDADIDINTAEFEFIRTSQEFKTVRRRIEEMRKKTGSSEIAITLEEKDFHPEAVAYDESKKVFYIGSVHKRKIAAAEIDSSGNVTIKDFIPGGRDGLGAVLGMRVDPKNRILWACSAHIRNIIDFDENAAGRTGVFKFHLDTGNLIKKYILQRDDDHRHFFGDLVLHSNGDVYITDSSYPTIYRIPAQTDRLEMFMDLARDPFRSLQGLDLAEEKNILFVTDYTRDIYVIDIAAREVTDALEHPDTIPISGIDGLYFFGNSLIAIQNGVNPMRVSQFFLDDQLRRVTGHRVIENANPLFDEPTLGVITGENTFYYVANSQWKAYDEDGTIFPLEKLQEPVILKVTL
ncbi:MAG: hypothetical protein GY950_18000 [bacterium]|nr:hypothetical protein [bacterium]